MIRKFLNLIIFNEKIKSKTKNNSMFRFFSPFWFGFDSCSLVVIWKWLSWRSKVEPWFLCHSLNSISQGLFASGFPELSATLCQANSSCISGWKSLLFTCWKTLISVFWLFGWHERTLVVWHLRGGGTDEDHIKGYLGEVFTFKGGKHSFLHYLLWSLASFSVTRRMSKSQGRLPIFP